MHDILGTKAGGDGDLLWTLHPFIFATGHGGCTIVVSIWFGWSPKGSYSKVDVAVTYVLSVWAAAVPGDDIAVEGRVVELDNIWIGASIPFPEDF